MNFDQELQKINQIEKEMQQVVKRLDELRNEKHFLVAKINRQVSKQPCHHCQKPSTRIIDHYHCSCDDCYNLD